MEDMPTVEDVLEAKATMAGITSIDDTVWQQFTPPLGRCRRIVTRSSARETCPFCKGGGHEGRNADARLVASN
jgi:hypothetical protein